MKRRLEVPHSPPFTEAPKSEFGPRRLGSRLLPSESLEPATNFLEFKSKVTDLAVNGGPPAFHQPLHVGRPNLPDRNRLQARLNVMLDNVWLTNNGPFAREFERLIAAATGVKHCIATSSGTSALEIAAAAFNLTGEVIVPAMTFIATPHAFAWRGLTPVFADIDPETCCICPKAVERLITPRTSAIVGVHLWGRPCDTTALSEIAERHSLKLLFDSSHAFGCSHEGNMIGGFGDAEVFSFHATKFVSAGEGGAVVTNDDTVASRLRGIRNFGFTGVDEVSMVGTNAKMNEMSAAFGISSLEEITNIIEGNRATREAYRRAFESLPGIRLHELGAGKAHNFQYVVIRINEQEAGVSRDRFLQILQAENVLARRYFYPGCHRSQPYGSPETPCTNLPITDQVAKEVLCLPTGRSVSEHDVAMIGQLVKLGIQSASHMKIDAHLSSRQRQTAQL